ncbi:hypothetical protein CSUI_001324 [Cystoisospora suis]|uniref:Uncharacterized protein n=1 Tax=Cystoisospora suis TaxID=483139 RepID=A0A2C6LD47_9APIC|nr:hypothetical protein CSUI_001324 [Cystoisospora suis]
MEPPLPVADNTYVVEEKKLTFLGRHIQYLRPGEQYVVLVADTSAIALLPTYYQSQAYDADNGMCDLASLESYRDMFSPTPEGYEFWKVRKHRPKTARIASESGDGDSALAPRAVLQGAGPLDADASLSSNSVEGTKDSSNSVEGTKNSSNSVEGTKDSTRGQGGGQSTQGDDGDNGKGVVTSLLFTAPLKSQMHKKVEEFCIVARDRSARPHKSVSLVIVLSSASRLFVSAVATAATSAIALSRGVPFL